MDFEVKERNCFSENIVHISPPRTRIACEMNKHAEKTGKHEVKAKTGDVSFLSSQAPDYLFISIQLYFSAAAQRKGR